MLLRETKKGKTGETPTRNNGPSRRDLRLGSNGDGSQGGSGGDPLSARFTKMEEGRREVRIILIDRPDGEGKLLTEAGRISFASCSCSLTLQATGRAPTRLLLPPKPRFLGN